MSETTEFDIRGELAAALKCWRRLTAEEAQELVNFVSELRGRDSERLNWLEENSIKNVSASTDGPAYKHLQFAGKMRADWTFDVGNMPLREAIDKAADALEITK